MQADGFPGADILSILSTGELGNPQVSGFIADIGLRPGSAQGTAGAQKHPQPFPLLDIVFLLQLEGREFQITDRGPGWCSHRGVVIQEVAIGIRLETQGSHPAIVKNAQQII